ncbi:MAG: hypothetical protein QF775_04135 [archaeon]|nr:hypothetical protein [archaeon]
MTTVEWSAPEDIHPDRCSRVLAARIVERHDVERFGKTISLVGVREEDSNLLSSLAVNIARELGSGFVIEVIFDDQCVKGVQGKHVVLATSVVINGQKERDLMERVREIVPQSTIRLVAIAQFEQLLVPLDVNCVRMLLNPSGECKVEITFGENGKLEITDLDEEA